MSSFSIGKASQEVPSASLVAELLEEPPAKFTVTSKLNSSSASLAIGPIAQTKMLLLQMGISEEGTYS